MSTSIYVSRGASDRGNDPSASAGLQNGLMGLVGAAGEALGMVRAQAGENQLDGERLMKVMREISSCLNACMEAVERLPACRAENAPRGVVWLRSSPSGGLSFLDFGAVCLRELESQRAPGTLLNLRRAIACTRETFGTMPIAQVDAQAVRAHLEAFQAGALPGQTHPPAVSTCSEHFSMLRHVFAMAVEKEVIATSPMNGLVKPRQPKPEAREQALDEGEAQRLIRCLQLERPMWRALVLLMMDTGARRGETVGLRWEDIDFETGRMTICQNLQYTPGVGVYARCPKSGKARTVYINAYALEALAFWRGLQRAEALERGQEAPACCFTGADGHVLHPQSVTRYLEALARKYNFARLHPHMLRHTMATLSIAHGADVVSVSKKLGHAHTSLTLDVYSHANAEAQRRANQALSRALYE